MSNCIYINISKSSNLQYSHPPFGNGRLIINGIFFSLYSFNAIIYPSITVLSTSTSGLEPELICFVRSPNILAFSYLVIKGNVRCNGSIIVLVESRVTIAKLNIMF